MNQNIIKHFDDYAKSHRWQDYYDNGLNSDNCNFYLRFEAFKKIVRDMFPKKVIDLGCGSGDFLRFFIYSDTYYHGVDFSHEMVRAVKKKIEDLPESIRHRFSCEQEDFITMEISEKYDFLLASGFLEYFDNLKMVAKKMHDLTETNGYVLVQIPNVNITDGETRNRSSIQISNLHITALLKMNVIIFSVKKGSGLLMVTL